jgi:hypothetical protein
MYRVRNKPVGKFISKIKKYRRSRGAVSSTSLSYSRASNLSIESVPYSDNLAYVAPFLDDSNGANVQATIQSATAGTVGGECSRKSRANSSKLRRPKCYKDRRVPLGEFIKNFPSTRYHCLFDEENQVVAYFSDATLYSIPEHGAGLCFAKFSTAYPNRKPDEWSVEHSNDRPHHRRS